MSLVLCLSLVTPVVAGPSAADEIIERVLATVSGVPITQSDVAAARTFRIVAVDGSDRDVLSRLIDRSLMLAEVDRYAPPEPEAAAVEREVESARARFADAQAFASALARAGMDEKYLRDLLRQNLRIRVYLDQRFAAQSPGDRDTLVNDWIATLRRRAAITEPQLDPR